MAIKKNTTTENVIKEDVPTIEKSMLLSQWIHEYGQNLYKSTQLNIFRYQAQKHNLGAFTPSEWNNMIQGIKALPKN